jgi:hypothetical protein
MAAISDTHHVSPECDLRTGCEAFCQRNVHKPRLIPLSVAAVVQIHALWCALSLPPRLRRCCHQSRPTAQLAADRAVEEPCPTRSNLRANAQSPNRANVLRFLASHALGTCDFSPDVARFMQNRRVSNRGAQKSQVSWLPQTWQLGSAPKNDLAFAIRNWNDIGRVMAPKSRRGLRKPEAFPCPNPVVSAAQ